MNVRQTMRAYLAETGWLSLLHCACILSESPIPMHNQIIFFDLIQGFLLNYRDIPHGCFLVCELLCCDGRSHQYWYRSDGNQNDTAGKSYHTRLYCLTNILIFFTLYFVYTFGLVTVTDAYCCSPPKMLLFTSNWHIFVVGDTC